MRALFFGGFAAGFLAKYPPQVRTPFFCKYPSQSRTLLFGGFTLPQGRAIFLAACAAFMLHSPCKADNLTGILEISSFSRASFNAKKKCTARQSISEFSALINSVNTKVEEKTLKQQKINKQLGIEKLIGSERIIHTLSKTISLVALLIDAQTGEAEDAQP